jgi:hypothetical protein
MSFFKCEFSAPPRTIALGSNNRSARAGVATPIPTMTQGTHERIAPIVLGVQHAHQPLFCRLEYVRSERKRGASTRAETE